MIRNSKDQYLSDHCIPNLQALKYVVFILTNKNCRVLTFPKK